MNELLVEREWLKEKRLGVDHFRPGQIVVEPSGDVEDGRAVFVAAWTQAMGHAVCCMLYTFDGDVPVPDVEYVRRSGLGVQVVPLPADYMPSRRMVELLTAAKTSGARVEHKGESWMDEQEDGQGG